ncbi:Flavohemoprotein (Hemoglobin-like protein) (Flavohemoglobin) (Nitric oxide dioxygenase) [plant metagenome]
MLSESSRPYIDASVPVLREHGLAITQTFYRSMFEAHPELKNLFNMGNQASGAQQQSLASAVFAYAANHRNAGALTPVLSRIAHKHAAVGLTSAHYPIVGKHLLGAIRTVLGDAATPELMAAWDEAYWLLAGELIAAEARLYDRAGKPAAHRHAMMITERVAQTADIVSLRLVLPDDQAAPAFLPGQYISVVVELSPGVFQQRQYSLSDAPNGRDLRISVQRDSGTAGTPAGVVSNWLHANAKVGDILRVSQPYGDFAPALDGERPIVLLSGGVGVTPMVSVLNALVAARTPRRVVFAHAARGRGHVAHAQDIALAADGLPGLDVHLFLESGETALLAGFAPQAGRMDAGALVSADPELREAEFHLCGPLPFMQAQRAALLAQGVPAERIHREVFGPDLLDHLL